MTDSIHNAHINANADNAIKATKQNANKGKKQNSKADALLEKMAIDAVKSPEPQKPESMLDHQHKAIETSDFIKIEGTPSGVPVIFINPVGLVITANRVARK